MSEDAQYRQLIGSQLRSLRESRKLSAAEVARRASMTPHTLWRYEAGRALPGVAALDALARVLGVTIDELVHPPIVGPEVLAEQGR